MASRNVSKSKATLPTDDALVEYLAPHHKKLDIMHSRYHVAEHVTNRLLIPVL